MFKTKMVWAANLDDAYKQGYFTGSMTRDELMSRITKYNKDLRWFANKTHRALYDTSKGNKAFICGIAHTSIIPKYTIQKHDPRMMKTLSYSDEHGDVYKKESIYTGDDEGLVLARGWTSTLNIVKKRGYQVNEKDLY